MAKRRTSQKNVSCLTRAGQIDYLLRRSSRRRSMEIVVGENGQVSVHAPFFVRQEEISRFIEEKADWIRNKVAEIQAAIKTTRVRDYRSGREFFYQGKRYPLHVQVSFDHSPDCRWSPQGWRVSLPLSRAETADDVVKTCLMRWYRHRAEEVLPSRVEHWSRVSGFRPSRVVVKSQKKIWGSCSHHQRVIRLNWQLIMAPLEVMDYVVVHELCHLKVPDHSRRFWKAVGEILPDYKQRQIWLKHNGSEMVLP